MNTPMLECLDLCCGGGGAGMGYHRAGFKVTGIDIKPQKRYPFDFIQGDAMEYLAAHGHKYDFVHVSPPCQGYSELTPPEHRAKHPLLIATFRELLKQAGKPYVIENVEGARKHMVNPIMLCGSMFGLRIWRHRYFETSFPLWFAPGFCDHSFEPVLISGTTRRKTGRFEYSVQECRDASGIDWMIRKELDEAIPPVFTEWIGKQAIKYLQVTS